MRTRKPEAVLLEGLVFGEGPRWRDGRLWLSDMHAGFVLALDSKGRAETIARVPARPSGLGWLPDGRLLVVSMHDRKLLRLDPGGLVVHADLAPLVSGDPNDMVVDDRGRAYVGNFGYDMLGGGRPAPANLVLVAPDGSARVVAEDLSFPNGTVITEDRRTLVVAESFGARLTAFRIAPDGSLAERRLFADLGGRTPDGICIDAEGCVWASCFGQDEFVRVRDGGEIVERVDVAGRRAVACALGGEGRLTLFLLTAETSIEDLAQSKSRAKVETVRVDVPGAGIP
jgi:sugar lactone lactonase YvrE